MPCPRGPTHSWQAMPVLSSSCGPSQSSGPYPAGPVVMALYRSAHWAVRGLCLSKVTQLAGGRAGTHHSQPDPRTPPKTATQRRTGFQPCLSEHHCHDCQWQAQHRKDPQHITCCTHVKGQGDHWGSHWLIGLRGKRCDVSPL